MSVGISQANFANAALNHVGGGTAWTQPAGRYVQLHKGDPGAAGTANLSAVTTRQAATFNAASSGSITLSNTPTFNMTTAETITHISVWSASSGGNFLWSAQLSVQKQVTNFDTIKINSITLAFTTIAV